MARNLENNAETQGGRLKDTSTYPTAQEGRKKRTRKFNLLSAELVSLVRKNPGKEKKEASDYGGGALIGKEMISSQSGKGRKGLPGRRVTHASFNGENLKNKSHRRGS